MAEPVLVLHFTQGTTIGGAVQAMARARSQCHEVVDPGLVNSFREAASQALLPWTVPARSLKHPPGTPETNNRGWAPGSKFGRCYQIEIVGYSEQAAGYGDHWYRLLADYLRDRCADLGVPYRFPYPFVGKDAYGASARQRLTWAQWATVSGIVGHQHVPGNEHWDPGAIDVPRLLSTPPPSKESPTMAVPQPTLGDVQLFVAGAFAAVDNHDPFGEHYWTWQIAMADDWKVPANELRRQLGLK